MRRKFNKKSNKKRFARRVKAIVAKNAAFIGDGFYKYDAFNDLGVYSHNGWNYRPGPAALPLIPYHGYKGLMSATHDYKGTWDTYLAQVIKTASVPAGGAVNTGNPSANSVTIRCRKRRLKFWMHNPMTEVVSVRFWLALCEQSMPSTNLLNSFDLWEDGFNDESNITYSGSGQDIHNFYRYRGSGPFKYKQVREHWKLLHKFETTFLPGQTKTYSCSLPPFSYCVQNFDDGLGDYYAKGGTWQMIWETIGVPTMQNNGTNFDTNVIGWSPSGLEIIFHKTLEFGVQSVNTLKFVDQTNLTHYQDKPTDPLTESYGLTAVADAKIRAI